MNGRPSEIAGRRKPVRRWLLAALTLILITSCGAPAARPAAAPGEEPAPGAAPKTLIVGVQREPADLGVLFGQGTSNSAGGAGSVKLVAEAKLAIETELDHARAQLAGEQ